MRKEMNFCLNCGKKLPVPNCHFCPYCGMDLRPYISAGQESDVSTIKPAESYQAPKQAEAPLNRDKPERAEATSTNLGEEVRNLKENMVTQEPSKPDFETPVRTVADETQEKPVDKPAERVEANHEEEKISELPKVKMPTRSRKPLKDIPVADDLKEDEEPAQPVPKHAVVEYSATNDEKPQPESQDVVTEPDEVVTTPDPDTNSTDEPVATVPTVSQRPAKHIVVTPDEVDLGQKKDDDDDLDDYENVVDEPDEAEEQETPQQSEPANNVEEDYVEKPQEPAQSELKQEPKQPVVEQPAPQHVVKVQSHAETVEEPVEDEEASATTEPASAKEKIPVNMPNVNNESNNDLGSDYIDDDQDSSADKANSNEEAKKVAEKVSQNSEEADTHEVKAKKAHEKAEQEVDVASNILSDIFNHLDKQGKNKQAKGDKSQATEPKDNESENSDDDSDNGNVASIEDLEDTPTELPDEYAPKSSETVPNKTTQMTPDSDVQDSLYRESQPKPKVHHRPFAKKEANIAHKPSNKKQNKLSKMNFGF